jgi:hypothetical protein
LSKDIRKKKEIEVAQKRNKKREKELYGLLFRGR